MYESGRITDPRGNRIRVPHPTLPEYPVTQSAAIIAGATSITVADNEGFANGNFLILGQPRVQKTEKVTVGAAVTRGTALTISAATFDHPEGSPVRLSLWDQVEISGADTVAGTKTVIATVSINFSLPDTEYTVTGTTFNFYFTRFKHSVIAAFSQYSDAIPANGYAPDTVRAVKTTALNRTGESIDGVITDDFLNTEVVNCEIDLWKEKRRWAHFFTTDYILGTLAGGQALYPLPTDISDNSTREAIRSVRLRNGGELVYAEHEVLDRLLYGVGTTTLAVATTVGATEVTLTSVADFDDSGSFLLGADELTYTGRDTTLNKLTGIPATGTGSITAVWPASTTYAWFGNYRHYPAFYTIVPGYLSLILPPLVESLGNAIYLSYYRKPSYPDSDADLLSWPDPELYHLWLAWKIDLRRHSGTPNEASMKFEQEYKERKALLLSRARLQDTPRFVPSRFRSRQNMSGFSDMFNSWVLR